MIGLCEILESDSFMPWERSDYSDHGLLEFLVLVDVLYQSLQSRSQRPQVNKFSPKRSSSGVGGEVPG